MSLVNKLRLPFLFRSLTYDSGDRETSDAYGSFGYNAEGDVTLAYNANATYTLQYDNLGEVTQVGIVPLGVTLNMGYDDQGNRTSLAASSGDGTLDGTQISVYDLDNRLTSLSYNGQSQSLSETIGYYPGGEVSSVAMYSSGTLIASADYVFASNEQVSSITDKFANGSTLASYDYSYNSLQQLTQAVENGTTITYGYDSDGQLTSAGSVSYAYDSNGNPTNGGTDQTTGDNELTQFVDNAGNTWTYSYDLMGNRTQAVEPVGMTTTTWNYTYNNANQMSSATESINGTTIQTSNYQYDAFGNLFSETITTSGSTAISNYVVDGWNPANATNLGTSRFTDLAILDGRNSNTLITRQIASVGTQAGDETAAMARIDTSYATNAAGAYWLLTDRLGSVRDILDNTPNDPAVDQIQYDAFGNIMSQTMGAANYYGARGFAGYFFDSATSLNINGPRVYDPVSRQWLSQDPERYAAGDNNLYRYVGNLPTMRTDPSGMYQYEIVRDNVKKVDVVQLNVAVSYDFSKMNWNQQQEKQFEVNFTNAVEGWWNNSPYVIKSSKQGNPWPDGLVPRINIYKDKIPGQAGAADINVVVTPDNPAGQPGGQTFYDHSKMTAPATGEKGKAVKMQLSESAATKDMDYNAFLRNLRTTNKNVDQLIKKYKINVDGPRMQNIIAHEFGHFLGLEHPGYGVTKDPYEEYLIGDPDGLMGIGNEYRKAYYDRAFIDGYLKTAEAANGPFFVDTKKK